MLPSGSINTVSPTTWCFRGSITRLACSLSTLGGWVTLLRPRLACGLLAMLWPRGTCTHWVSSSNFKVASRASFPNEPGFSWRNNRSQGFKVRCASNNLIVSVYRVPQMQGVGCADVLLVLQVPDNKADAVPCERLPALYYHHHLIPTSSTVSLSFIESCSMTSSSSTPKFIAPNLKMH